MESGSVVVGNCFFGIFADDSRQPVGEPRDDRSAAENPSGSDQSERFRPLCHFLHAQVADLELSLGNALHFGGGLFHFSRQNGFFMKIPPLRQEWSERIYAYESRLDKTQRTRTGTFYTPWEIVQPMVEKTLQPLTLRADGSFRSLEELRRVRIADPACGTGVFLLEACFQWGEILRQQAEREGKDLPQPCREVVRRNLWGIDIDSQAVEIARELLTLAGEGEVPPNLFVADSLKNWQNRAIFPDGGFDALIGNPPFLGGRKIRRMLGDDYFQFLTEEFAPGVSGNADLCAYFFRLAEKVVRPGGICGFLATNTIAEGDTRRGGLDVLVQKGARIFHAERFSWQRDAVVQVRGIHLQLPGNPDAFEPPCQLYGKRVEQIVSSLKTLNVVRKPATFPENRDLCFQGWVLASQGFLLTLAEAEEFLARDARNREVIFPYFTGEDVFLAPDTLSLRPRRMVIFFHDWPLEKAQSYPDVFRLVEERVGPQRRESRRPAHRQRWWHFGDKRPALTRILREKGLRKMLLQTRHAKYLTPTWVPVEAIYSESSILFPVESDSFLAILNSAIHECWVREMASSLGLELRYTPTTCLNTFPFPPPAELPGKLLFDLRTTACREKNFGLTELYNHFHDPTCQSPLLEQLREVHRWNDRLLLQAYGWDDLLNQATHDFLPTSRGVRFFLLPPVQQEILHRLMEKNNQKTVFS